MAELSPAARAVLTAATQRLYCLDPEDVPLSASEHGNAIAAALRAVADRVVPANPDMPERWEEKDKIRADILTIATELENQ